MVLSFSHDEVIGVQAAVADVRISLPVWAPVIFMVFLLRCTLRSTLQLQEQLDAMLEASLGSDLQGDGQGACALFFSPVTCANSSAPRVRYMVCSQSV